MTFADLHDRCVLPVTFPVCGVELPPLRFGTARSLVATGLASPRSWDALRAAVLVCSQPPGALQSLFGLVRTGARRRRIDRWLRKARARYVLRDECSAFAAFYRYWSEPPEALRNSDRCDSKPCAMPYHQHLRSCLLAHLNYSPETLDDAPFAQCLMDYYAWAEAEGILRILTMSADQREALMATAEADQ